MLKFKVFSRSILYIVPAVFMLVVAGCATLRVSTDYNRSTDFARYHTYSWVKVSASTTLWQDRIRRDVNQELSSKGWQEVPSGGQASVTAFGATREIPSLDTFYSGFGPGYGGWGWGGWGMGPGGWGPGWGAGFGGSGFSNTQVVYTPVGSLVVDIFNSTNKRLIWRGVARQALSGSAEKNENKLMHAVDKMFRNFPPPSLG